MATNAGDRFVRRHNASRGSTSNTTAADITYDTPVLSEGGYSWSSPEVTVDETANYLCVYDLGQVDLASTRACGTLVPSVNSTDQTRFRATHRYTRNSGGSQEAASIGMAVLSLTASDAVKVRNPAALTPTDAVGNYATNTGFGGALQLIRLPDGNVTHVERTVDAAEVGTSNINTTRPWLDSSGTWTTITYNSEVQDDDALYSGTGGDITLAANTKYMIVWGATIYSTDASRHTDVVRLQIAGNNVQSGSGYQRNTASQGVPMCGMYLHETGGTTETLRLQATHETEGGDAGTPNVSDAYLQVVELPSSAEWIHADNGATDSLTTALAGLTTWYDTPLSSTLRADGDSNLSLDSVNDAIQNDSGASLPVLAIGWHRWDRDSGSSGTRKAPWTRWDNGGSSVGYGVAGAYSRGQQSGDDTFQAHYCSAVTLDLANGADLSFQVQDEASGSNADMGIYASTSRYFLGVQVLNLDSLDAGGGSTDALLADDVQSTSETGSPSVGQEHGLTSTDVESASELASPVVGQEHSLTSVDVESNSELTSPSLGQSYALTSVSVSSSTELSAPSLAQVHSLSANSVSSLTEAEEGTLGQEHGLFSTDVETNSELSTPAVGQSHDLSSVSVESAVELTAPTLADFSNVDNLLAEDIESASSLDSPAVGQVHGLDATDVQATTELTLPTLASSANTDNLLADDVESSTSVDTASIGQEHVLSSSSVESASELSSPVLVQIHQLNSSSVESSSELSSPTAGEPSASNIIYGQAEWGFNEGGFDAAFGSINNSEYDHIINGSQAYGFDETA